MLCTLRLTKSMPALIQSSRDVCLFAHTFSEKSSPLPKLRAIYIWIRKCWVTFMYLFPFENVSQTRASLVNFQSSCFQFYDAMWEPQRKYWKLTWKHEFKRARELFRKGKSWMREYRSLSDENDIFPFSDSRPLLIGKNRYFTASLLIPTPSSFLKSVVILGWKCGRMAPP